jgi:hypothetical protein
MLFHSKDYSNNFSAAPSRKDDLISLFYLLIYLHRGGLLWSTVDVGDLSKAFDDVVNMKIAHQRDLL